MTWLTWRQYRTAILTSAAFVLALVVWMVVVEHDYTVTSHALSRLCPTNPAGWDAACDNRSVELTHIEDQAGVIRVFPLVLPVVLGVLLGVPLVASDLEHGTVMLAFTQSVSRMRWLVARWLTAAAAVVVLTSVLAATTNWWFGHVQTNATAGYLVPPPDRIQPATFDVTGIVLVAYTLFAFALAAALGALLRRRYAAGVVATVLFIAARAIFGDNVRPMLAARLFQPVNTDTGGFSLVSGPMSWDSGPVWRHIPGSRSPSSQAYVNRVVNDLCLRRDPQSCLVAHGVQFGYYYQPDSHYWVLQWGEAAAFVAAAVALFGVTVWAVRRWRA